MAASTKNTPEVTAGEKDEVDKLFDEPAGLSEDDFDDLLDSVEEDDSEGWVPKQKGEGISGKVIKVGTTRSDFANDGEDPMCPTVVIETKSGDKWRVIGYGTVLKREMIDQNPEVGDLMAVKYFGEKPIKSGRFQGKPYKHYGVLVRKAAKVA